MDLSEFRFSIAHMGKIAKWLVWTIEIIFYVIAGAGPTAQLTYALTCSLMAAYYSKNRED
jgi:hypothetical protein